MIDNLRFITLLKEQGSASEKEIQLWLADSQKMSLSLTDYLYLTRPLDPKDVLALVAKHYNLPTKSFELREKVPKEILETLPEESARNYKMIVFDKNTEGLYVGLVDPDIPRIKETIDFLARRTSLKVKQFLVTPLDFYRVVSQYHSFEEEVNRAVEAFQKVKPGQAAAKRGGAISLELIETAAAEEAPVVRLVSSVFKEAVVEEASDIHFEPLEDTFRVRFRLEGKLKTIVELPKELGSSINTRIKVMSELKLDENRVPQDGRIRAFIEGREIDFRVATLPTPNGEAIAIRILDPTTGLKKLSDLGLAEYQSRLLDKAIDRPYGLIVVAGPTGSGKTTTQYAVLQRLNQETKNIITLEDPIEYRIRGVNQSQVKPEIGYTFASGLRQILRQDPNIILVGEVRDEETAELVTHAALTGHLVFTTLHANDALSVIPRLLDLKVRRFLLPSTLIIMVSQRLIRRLCPECHKKESVPQSLEREIDAALQGVSPEILQTVGAKKPYEIYRPVGCEKCNQTGYKGRVGLFEVIEMTPEIGRAILDEKGTDDLKDIARRQGTIFLRQDGIIKALQGAVTVEEVLKETV